jgi:hypothetical protein
MRYILKEYVQLRGNILHYIIKGDDIGSATRQFFRYIREEDDIRSHTRQHVWISYTEFI